MSSEKRTPRQPAPPAICIDPALVSLGFHAGNSQQVIYHLAEMLAVHGAVQPGYGQATWEREQSYPTGLPTEGFYVALPHADAQGVYFDALALAVCMPPVKFRNMADPSQELPVEIVIMTAVSDGKRQVKMLQRLAELFGEPQNLQALRDCATESEAAALLRRLLLHSGEQVKG